MPETDSISNPPAEAQPAASLPPAPSPAPSPGPSPEFARSERYPYPASTYVARALWLLVYATLWKLSVRPLHVLRPRILRLFGARVSLKVNLAGSAWVEMPWSLECGEHVTVGARAILYNLGGLRIGSNAVISQDAYICGGTHDYTQATYPLVRKPITIGSGVWIAAGAFIGPGVTVGDGAVVGARAVVTKDVEPWTVVAGNPARFIKRRELKA
jgi:putative colanic acid biosynthesis acetyltransferase WcaF